MPSQYSDRDSRSSIECSAQKLVGTVIGVASQVTAFAPFSQNSATDRCSGSGQAQLMQSKPSFWFIEVKSFAVRATPIFRSAGSMEWRMAGTPTAQSCTLPTCRSG